MVDAVAGRGWLGVKLVELVEQVGVVGLCVELRAPADGADDVRLNRHGRSV